MSESVGIVCPVCRSKLRLKGSVLSKATVPCPKCGTTLDVPKSESPSSPAPRTSAPLPQTSSPQSTVPAAEPTRPVAKAAQDAPKPAAGPLRKRKKAADDIPNPYGEDGSSADAGGDLFSGGSNDEFSGFGPEPDPYRTPGALPPRKRQSSGLTSATTGAESEFPSEASGTRRGGFFSWVGYGSLAAIAGIVLQTLLGFTSFLWPLLIATIVTGSMVGYAVRHAAGMNKGWGPGIVAVLITAFAIFAGRVGAFSVSPDVDKILGIPMAPVTPQEAEARVVKESAEPFLIADIADEVEYDEDFMTTQNIDSDEVSDFWLEHSEEDDPSKRYFPAIWTEATRRWNAKTPEQKESIRKTKELQLREDYGIMSDADVQQRITEATTNDAMISEIANTLLNDEEWKTKAGITQEQIDAHWENADFDEDASGEAQYLPAVWTEAKRRWEELPLEQKQARIKEMSDNLRADLVFSPEEAKDAENFGKAVRIVIIIFGALFTLFWGIGSLICSISALAGAFKIGSGLNVAK